MRWSQEFLSGLEKAGKPGVCLVFVSQLQDLAQLGIQQMIKYQKQALCARSTRLKLISQISLLNPFGNNYKTKQKHQHIQKYLAVKHIRKKMHPLLLWYLYLPFQTVNSWTSKMWHQNNLVCLSNNIRRNGALLRWAAKPQYTWTVWIWGGNCQQKTGVVLRKRLAVS